MNKKFGVLVIGLALASFGNSLAAEQATTQNQNPPATTETPPPQTTTPTQPTTAPQAVTPAPLPTQGTLTQTSVKATQGETKWYQKVASRVRPRIMMYYQRGLVSEKYADFSHQLGFTFSLGVNIQPTLIATVSFSLDRELGIPIERFTASNMRLALTKNFKFDKVGWLSAIVFGGLPTNDDDRIFLSYRGTLGTAVSFFNDQVFKFRGNIHAFGGGVSIGLQRDFYQFTTPIGGGIAAASPNLLWRLGFGANLIYTLYERLSFIAYIRNGVRWSAVGRADDRYEIGGTVQFNAPYGIRAGVTVATADRSFDYDQVTSNLRLYKSDSTSIFFTLGFAPAFETLTQ